ncbi:NADP-dependent alcohol dehydrogenase 6, partial [Lachnellula arida]
MVYPDTFEGFQVDGSDTWTTFTKREIKPKPFGDYDVDVKILACGVSQIPIHKATFSATFSMRAPEPRAMTKLSSLNRMRLRHPHNNQQLGPKHFPLCISHEIIGVALRVGPKATLTKTGQRVGVGAQIYSCLACTQCRNDNETYCRHLWPDTGIVSQDGWASHIRAHEVRASNFQRLNEKKKDRLLIAELQALGIPHPRRAGEIQREKDRYSIVGLGGIGHFGVLFAKALGAETWVIRDPMGHGKEADALELGADGFIATADKEWNEPHRMTFELIINTAYSSEGFELE